MAIEDFLPPIFTGTPSMYQGLLTDPKDRIALERRANLGGLLSAGAALAQGMSPQGYRRSALQNVLTALAAGYGGAAQTYESGINQMANVMKLQQSKRQLEGLQKLAQANPDLAYLASVSPEEFVKQVSARERMKMYGLNVPSSQAAPAPVSAPAPATEVAPAPAPIAEAPAGLISSGGFVGGGYGSADMAAPPVVRGIFSQSAPAPVVTTPAATVAAPVVTAPAAAPSAVAPTPTSFVSPENQAEAARFRSLAVLAKQQGDEGVAEEFKRKAEELDPKEEYFVRDGALVSNKRGKLIQFQQVRILPKDEAEKRGFPVSKGQQWQEDFSGKISKIEGTETTELDKNELIKTLPGQFVNVYPTLQPRVNALIARADKLTKDQINAEVQNILNDDSKILADLDPRLQAAELARRKASKTDVNVYTGNLSKTTATEVEKNVLSNAEAVSRLNSIYGTYRPEYLNIPFRAKQEWTNITGKFQKISPKDRDVLTGYYSFKQNSLQNLNKTIKDLTGAAMGVQEADRIIASLPNAGSTILGGDSPVEFEAKLNNAIEQTKYALARQTYALKNGIKEDVWNKIPLSDMPSIVNKRAGEIAKAYNLDPDNPKNPNREADKQTIKRQLAAEFGIPF
jgi:hypothetical protein